MRLKRRAEAVAPFGVALNNQLPSQGKGPDGVLDEVRVDRDPAVLDVTDELRPLGIQVMQRFTEEAARRDHRGRGFEPLAQFIEDRCASFLTGSLPRFIVAVLQFPLDVVELADQENRFVGLAFRLGGFR